MVRSRIVDSVTRRARELGARAARELVSGDNGARVAEAVRRVQEGRRAIDEKSAQWLSSLGLASHADVERLSRKIGKLRKRLGAILDELDRR